MRRRELLESLVAIGVSLPGLALAANPKPEVQVFKSRSCSCCAVWVGHLREAGFKVTVPGGTVVPRPDQRRVRTQTPAAGTRRRWHGQIVVLA